MSILTASELSKSFGAKDIFSGISVDVPKHARIGLVGANGIGKTTLLKVLLGEEQPTVGAVHRARALKLAYLPQKVMQVPTHTLWQECLLPFENLLQMQSELSNLANQMAQAAEDDQLLKRWGSLQSSFEHQGGYGVETRIRQVLGGLGFSQSDYHSSLEKFSGGERTRAMLARLLLSAPDLLLLDEPTNHLDIEATEWLEGYLGSFPGAVLLVSHDRYFLDRVVNCIWEMTPAIEEFRGNYTAYLNQREERYRRRLEEYTARQVFIARQEDYIRRNIAGQNSRQAQGRLKRLERLLRDARLTPPQTQPEFKLHLTSSARSGDLVLRTDQLVVGYADDRAVLFKVPDLTLRRGECAAIIGPNGAGKTTFLKTILEQIPPLQGCVQLGASLHIGYLSQAHEELAPQLTLIEQIQYLSPRMLPAQVRHHLARFLFTGDDVFQQVSTLSGGERSRLALACLVLQGANLLLLDEPTSHLDLTSQEMLQRALAQFDATILLVSHDRYLVDALASQVWEVKPADRSLLVFPGTYSEYKQKRLDEAGQAKKETSPVKRPQPSSRAGGVNKQKLEKLEQEIAALEADLKTLSAQLEDTMHSHSKVAELGSRFVELQQELEEKIGEWDTILTNQAGGETEK